MSPYEFITSVAIILAAMAVATLLELGLPLFALTAAQRPRRRANLALTACTLLFNWALTSLAALLALALSLDGWTPMAWLGLPTAPQLLVGVVVLDFFFGYLAHRAMHMSPLLWRVHRVHHSDPFVDVSTTYRTHPIEVLWRFLFMSVPIWALGIPADAVVVYRLISAINGTLEHANIGPWGSALDAVLARVWVTPNMHKVHHSRIAAETDSNYGNIFSIFDRALQTFTATHRALAVVYGLDNVDRSDRQSLPALLWMPFRGGESTAAGQIRPSEGLRMAQKARTMLRLGIALALAASIVPKSVVASTASSNLDTAHIEELTGAKGKLDETEGVFKVSVPRSDLAVTVAGVRMTPPLGLTSWAAFKPAEGHAMVMGDLVLLEDQVNPVMSAALDNGLQVTALHNHFAWDTPKVMFMHIAGMGDVTALAGAVGKVFAKMKDTSGGKGNVPTADIDPGRTSLAPEKIDAILGTHGELNAGVYKTVIGRSAKMDGIEIGASMGVNTWAAFAGSDDKAVVDGDFAMLESELQPVLKALRGSGINVVAIHQHMTGESPRIMFLHYWGIGPTQALATGLRAALDTQRR